MKFLPLIWSCLWRKPARTLLAFISVTLAFTLFGLALGEAEGFRRMAAVRHQNLGSGGNDFALVAMAVSGIGIILILFLTANAMAQSVRQRMGEFGVLKAIGFSHRLILTLVATEAMLPCLTGAAIGLVTAKLLFAVLSAIFPPLAVLPAPVFTPQLLASAAALAGFIGMAGAALPVMRLRRLNVVAALAGR